MRRSGNQGSDPRRDPARDGRGRFRIALPRWLLPVAARQLDRVPPGSGPAHPEAGRSRASFRRCRQRTPHRLRGHRAGMPAGGGPIQPGRGMWSPPHVGAGSRRQRPAASRDAGRRPRAHHGSRGLGSQYAGRVSGAAARGQLGRRYRRAGAGAGIAGRCTDHPARRDRPLPFRPRDQPANCHGRRRHLRRTRRDLHSAGRSWCSGGPDSNHLVERHPGRSSEGDGLHRHGAAHRRHPGGDRRTAFTRRGSKTDPSFPGRDSSGQHHGHGAT
jgi:hypothetical protein